MSNREANKDFTQEAPTSDHFKNSGTTLYGLDGTYAS